MTTMNKISRKDFMKNTGKAVVGVAAIGTLSGALTVGAEEVNAQEAAPFPYEYKEIDPDQARDRAYEAYFEQGGWGIGIAEGIFGILADEYGYPYNQIPTETFILAAGGYQTASLCGALGAAATVVGFLTEPEEGKTIVRKLFNWYDVAEIPEYQEEGMDVTKTVAGSGICEISLGVYKEESASDSEEERTARCAGLTADVVGKTVELLNEELL